MDREAARGKQKWPLLMDEIQRLMVVLCARRWTLKNSAENTITNRL